MVKDAAVPNGDCGTFDHRGEFHARACSNFIVTHTIKILIAKSGVLNGAMANVITWVFYYYYYFTMDIHGKNNMY